MSIDVEVADGICTIVINRPERLNAMDAEHYQGLSQAWCRVRDDAGIRVAIITGAGDKSFTTGADIKSFLTRPPGYDEMWLTQRDLLLNRGLDVWKPVIAAVNGYCLGGGMTLLLATDIRVAVPHATFSLAEVKRGVVPGNGGTQRILRQVPHAIGMEMLLTGDSITAGTAERWGLVNKVVPADQLRVTALDYARRIAANAPLAVQAAKELALRSRDLDLASALRLEQVMNRMLMATEDAVEGPAAFAAKRPPLYKGR
ncbi:MAG: enoyl-CoA hydratase/isomerase family protein [Betaproteobacteria bacterium]|nr:enoyl-CoA hydratase/isomerase family protein [Betaproteobacteria bacterium]MDE2003598.1 enoyl-CoA hydratase/isomerase family protein [Betaproteobacteria bacterium]MDE2210720.1 enoyl-CoA hydratase/isomerase family protein [Betaproteobacteria bacterium]MDE2359185.1 enoyl-CoA hydratase/isomerase family protein [Betaproteobacteria bacterium]